MSKNKWITEKKKEEILLKLKPYLNAGLSVYKACLKAKIPWRTVYQIMEKDDLFKQKIEAEQIYSVALANQIIVYQINQIAAKINQAKEEGKPIKLKREEIELIKWYLTKHKKAKEEYSDRVEVETKDNELNKKVDKIGKLLMGLFEDENSDNSKKETSG